LAEKYFDLDGLLELECGLSINEPMQRASRLHEGALPVRVGIAFDSAFSFYYEDNLDLLREQGAEIVRFSPMTDTHLPCDLDALYLGGGYPELHAKQLSGNLQMLSEIKEFAASGKPVYAECGGMMYLSQRLRVADGTIYTMAGVLPLHLEMTSKLVQFGYVTVELTEECLLGPKGTVIRGHSFHYSHIASQTEIATSYKVQYSISGKEEFEGFHRGNILASYIHLHFRANPTVAEHFVTAIRNPVALQAVSV
jgi:cobyrinic acid a,c-diamide synthase